jgi:acetoin utilization deacetylase AcuC-like enzyme
MILYDPRHLHSLMDFGIEIPVQDSRASETFARLSSHPQLAATRAAWHIHALQGPVDRADLLRVHSADYVGRLFSAGLEAEIIRAFELIDADGNYHRYQPARATRPLAELFDRILVRAGGTLQCCRRALETGFCFYFGGGMHHAQKDYGAGFCVVNDLVTALRRLQAETRIRSAWVIDVDAHKGDGTAALTAGDDSIATLSIHMADGWPLDQPERGADGRPNPSFTPSTLDIPIAAGEEPVYNRRLSEGLERLAETGRPDLALVVCGADPYELDELPSTAGLRLSLEQLLERDQLVYSFLKARGIRSAWVMAGGYGRNSWRVYTQFLKALETEAVNAGPWALPHSFGFEKSRGLRFSYHSGKPESSLFGISNWRLLLVPLRDYPGSHDEF